MLRVGIHKFRSHQNSIGRLIIRNKQFVGVSKGSTQIASPFMMLTSSNRHVGLPVSLSRAPIHTSSAINTLKKTHVRLSNCQNGIDTVIATAKSGHGSKSDTAEVQHVLHVFLPGLEQWQEALKQLSKSRIDERRKARGLFLIATGLILGWWGTQSDEGEKSKSDEFDSTVPLAKFVDQAVKGNLTVSTMIDLYRQNQSAIYTMSAQMAIAQRFMEANVVKFVASMLVSIITLRGSIQTMQELYGNGVEMDALEKQTQNLANLILDDLLEDTAKIARDPGFEIEYEKYHKHIERMETDNTRKVEKLMSDAGTVYWWSLVHAAGSLFAFGVTAATSGPVTAVAFAVAAVIDGYNVSESGSQWERGRKVGDDTKERATKYKEWEVKNKFGNKR